MKIREITWFFALLCAVYAVSGNSSLLAEVSRPLFAPNVNSTINWDTVPSEMTGLELMKTGKTSLGEIKVYRNNLENLTYEGIKFNSIEYGFTEYELIFVAYKALGIDNWAAFKKLAIENYGPAFIRHESKRYYNYVWDVNGYSVALEYDNISKSSVLLLVSG